MLNLSLARITKLISANTLPWRAVHVAGTNGKGSVCLYTSRMLIRAGLKVGKFTSPHLIDRWDCISINEHPIAESAFASIESTFQQKSLALNLAATEFEILTATAFEAFSQAKVDVGVVEVGVGGRLDATNVLENPLATVITSISTDHQGLLGNSIEEIALQKAGILKKGAPCFAAASNQGSVRQVIESEAAAKGAESLEFIDSDGVKDVLPSNGDVVDGLAGQRFTGHSLAGDSLVDYKLADHQLANLSLALAATNHLLSTHNISLSQQALVSAALEAPHPGRLQWISVSSLTGRKAPVLLDGAHNSQSAQALGQHVRQHLRGESAPGDSLQAESSQGGPSKGGPSQGKPYQGVTWIIAASQGKDVGGMFADIIEAQDTVITTAFGAVQGMPWVEAVPAEQLADTLSAIRGEAEVRAVEGVRKALEDGSRLAEEGPLVVAGSLYLVSDVLRLLRDCGPERGD